jgi:hypothetical protein
MISFIPADPETLEEEKKEAWRLATGVAASPPRSK